MGTLTVCMIVRDEEERLQACLESLPPHDQLVIVDTGSVDRTVEIAQSFGAQVEHFEWVDDFAAARNYTETFATGDYIFWIDGDEVLTDGHDLIRQFVADGVINAVRPSCRMVTGQSHLRQEMLRKRGFGEWRGKVHEYTDCPVLGQVEPRIVFQHFDRAVTREWDPGLRRDEITTLVAEEGISFRVLSYLAREYSIATAWLEAAAIAETALGHNGPPIERSQLAILQGIAYTHLEQHDEARKSFCRAVSEDDTWPEPYYHLGFAYAKQGNYTAAIPWLWASSLIEPIAGHQPFGEDIAWRRYAVLGQCYVNIGRLAEGKHFLEQALGISGDDEIREQVAAVEKVMA